MSGRLMKMELDGNINKDNYLSFLHIQILFLLSFLS